MIKQLQIKDIQTGSLDAKDDYNLNTKDFISNFIIPPGIEADDFINNEIYFIEGFKGTGKTALIHYLKDYVKKNYNSITDMILFKTEYSEHKKNKIEKYLDETIEVDNIAGEDFKDFIPVWKWLFMVKIAQINICNDYGIFYKNKDWNAFLKRLDYISNPVKSNLFRKFIKLFKIKYSFETSELSLEPNENLISSEKDMEFDFYETIDDLFDLFKRLRRKKSNLFIFVDELETYYQETKVFKRDLSLIRDMIFTVKEFNLIKFQNGENQRLRIICGIRTEVISSIKNYVPAKELNKILFAYKKELNWYRPNDSSFNHPLMQIWINRIQNAEYKLTKKRMNSSEIMDKWFPKTIHSENIISNILNHTWSRPRDIIRFMMAAKNCSPDRFTYDKGVFSLLTKNYSKQSWEEVYEELNVVYTPKQILSIKKILSRMNPKFSYRDIVIESNKQVGEDEDFFISRNIDTILENLYSVGVIGNISRDSNRHRWKYKGSDELMKDSSMRMQVHFALRSEISIPYVHESEEFDIGKRVRCTVIGVDKNYAQLRIEDTDILGSMAKQRYSHDNSINDFRLEMKSGYIFNGEIYDISPKFGYQIEFLSEIDAKAMDDEDINEMPDGAFEEMKKKLMEKFNN